MKAPKLVVNIAFAALFLFTIAAVLYHKKNDIELHFLEIGTSDFDTFLQRSGKHARGVSMDALQIYLDRLPNRPNVIKQCAAVVPANSSVKTVPVYYIPPNVLKKNKLPYLFRGCNRVGKPHETVMKTLRKRNLTHLVHKMDVPALTPAQILDQHRIKAIKILKLDIEGLDAQLVVDFLKEILQRNIPLPRFVIYEENILSPSQYVSEAKSFIQNLGYNLFKTGAENVYYGLTEDIIDGFLAPQS